MFVYSELLFELMVLFRTKRFFSLWRVNRRASNLQEKILIQKSQALHIFAWLCSAPVGPPPPLLVPPKPPHNFFYQTFLKTARPLIEPICSLWYCIQAQTVTQFHQPTVSAVWCPLFHPTHNELDKAKYRVKSMIRHLWVSSKRENKQYIST